MSQRGKLILACLSLVVCSAMAGCDRSEGDKTPTTSINTPPTSGDGGAVPKSTFDDQHPVVVMKTTLGDITLQLEPAKTPRTVNNFLRYVASGQYDNTIVHQIYKGQLFLASGYDTNLVERAPRPPIENEAENGLKNQRGTIAMARLPDDIDSATCQFFINVADNPALDHKDRTADGFGYCAFGQVIGGADVVGLIANAPVQDTPDFDGTPAQAIIIKSMVRIR